MHWFKALFQRSRQSLPFFKSVLSKPASDSVDLPDASDSLAPAFSRQTQPSPSAPYSSLSGFPEALDSQTSTLLTHLSRSLYHAPIGCVLLSHRHQIIWFNPMAAQWLGLNKDDTFRPLTHILRSPAIVSFLMSSQYRLTIEQGRSYLRLQHISLLPTLSLLEIEPEDNRENIARVQRQFLGAVSHELNTPLTVLSGFLEILEATPSGSERQAIMQTLQHQITRLKGLAHQLLQLLRTEHSAPRFQYWDAISFFGRIEHEIHAIDVEGRKVVWNIDGSLDIYGDESMLYSAFRNLIDNAIRYTSAQNGQIHITWQRGAGGHPVFEVRDNGCGIAADHILRLGERFYRAGQDDTAGTGLGLSIVKEVVQHHHAELVIDSTLNEGSCFSIILRRQAVS